MSYYLFNRVVSSNFSDIDSIFSGFNANLFESNKLEFNDNNIVVVNDNVRSFSFLVSGLDDFRVIYFRNYGKYAFSKILLEKSICLQCFNLFDFYLNRQDHSFFYNSFIMHLNNYFFKSFLSQFIFSYKYLFFFNFVKLKIKGLGYRIRKISNELYYFFFNYIFIKSIYI